MLSPVNPFPVDSSFHFQTYTHTQPDRLTDICFLVPSSHTGKLSYMFSCFSIVKSDCRVVPHLCQQNILTTLTLGNLAVF